MRKINGETMEFWRLLKLALKEFFIIKKRSFKFNVFWAFFSFFVGLFNDNMYY